MYPYATTAEARFWAKVHKTDGCWLWTAGCISTGYGGFNLCKKPHICVTAHRFAYALAFGYIPPRMQVCHHCDNRRCVNPAHLFLGDWKANADDCTAKGRQNPWQGEQGHVNKLTEVDVLNIRRRLAARQGTIRGMAREYGVDRSTMQNVIHGRSWRYLL
jgi:hypothetical protein